MLLPLFALFSLCAGSIPVKNLATSPQTPAELLSYMQARGFMQIDEIVSEKPCVSYKFYITHDSTQKCLSHRCSDNTVMSEFDCKIWNKLKKNTEKPTKWTNQLTRRVRNQKVSLPKSDTSHGDGEYKESVLEIYSVKPDTCTKYSKIQSVKGSVECWRKNCKDEFSIRIQCKLFDGVKPQNREVHYKKRRHHGTA